MTRDDIISMARESGAYFQTFYPTEAFQNIKKENQEHFSGYVMSHDQIIEFALSIIAINNINGINCVRDEFGYGRLTQLEPQREWVRLTEQEHTELAIECGCLSADWVFYGAAVEQKLKEKNT